MSSGGTAEREFQCAHRCLALSAAAFSHWKARLSLAGRPPGRGACRRLHEICCRVPGLRREKDSRTLLVHIKHGDGDGDGDGDIISLTTQATIVKIY